MKSLEELGTITSGSLLDVLPKIILDEVEQAARARRFGRQLVRINEDLTRTKGRELIIARLGTVSAVTCNEGEAPTTSEVGVSTPNTITIGKIGLKAVITQEAIDASNIDIIRMQIQEAGYALAVKEDSDIMTALIAGYGSSVSMAGGTLTYAEIISAAGNIRAYNWEPNVIIMNPAQFSQILASDMFTDASKYGGREPLLRGEVGMISGLKVLVSTQIASGKALVLDTRQAGYLAIKRPVDLKRWDNPATDSVELYFFMEYGVKATRTEAIALIA